MSHRYTVRKLFSALLAINILITGTMSSGQAQNQRTIPSFTEYQFSPPVIIDDVEWHPVRDELLIVTRDDVRKASFENGQISNPEILISLPERGIASFVSESEIAVGNFESGNVDIFSYDRGEHAVTLSTDGLESVTTFDYNSRDNQLVVSGFGIDHNDPVSFWNMEDNSLNTIYTIDGGPILQIALDSNGRRLAVTTFFGEIQLWNTNNDSLETAFVLDSVYGIFSLVHFIGSEFLFIGQAFVPNNEINSSAIIWDINAENTIMELEGHQGNIFSVAYNSQKQLIATGDSVGNLYIWDATDFIRTASLIGHVEPISSLSWNSNGEYLASSSSDGSIRIWRTEDIVAEN